VGKGRGTVKAPKRRKPVAKPAPPAAIGGHGLAEALFEGCGEALCYDYERIRRDDAELMGLI
jgi:hypothetical protein